jgi:hypothetical protein
VTLASKACHPENTKRRGNDGWRFPHALPVENDARLGKRNDNFGEQARRKNRRNGKFVSGANSDARRNACNGDGFRGI